MANVKYEGTDHAKVLKELDWLNVRELIEYDAASMVYKIENGLVSTCIKSMFIKSSKVHSYSARSAASRDIGKASFSYHGACIWNQLLFKLGKLSLSNVFRIALKK